MPSTLQFTPVVFEDEALFRKIRQDCDLYNNSPASETTFESVFCWGASEDARRCIVDEGLIIFYQYPDGSKAFYPPLAKKREYFVPMLNRIAEYCWLNGFDVYIERLTKEMAELATEWDCTKCQKFEMRDDFEYLYKPSDLIELNGGHFKTKRNFINGFTSSYEYEFLSYEPSMKRDLLAFVNHCGKDPASHDFDAEFNAIVRALDMLDVLNLYCDVIKVDGKIIAFSIGFINEANVGVCMFEKADTDYRGSYVAINNFVAAKRFSKCKLVNRQEDLGIEGLRKSKMSYCPVGFSEKYIITDRPETLDLE